MKNVLPEVNAASRFGKRFLKSKWHIGLKKGQHFLKHQNRMSTNHGIKKNSKDKIKRVGLHCTAKPLSVWQGQFLHNYSLSRKCSLDVVILGFSSLDFDFFCKTPYFASGFTDILDYHQLKNGEKSCFLQLQLRQDFILLTCLYVISLPAF